MKENRLISRLIHKLINSLIKKLISDVPAPSGKLICFGQSRGFLVQCMRQQLAQIGGTHETITLHVQCVEGSLCIACVAIPFGGRTSSQPFTVGELPIPRDIGASEDLPELLWLEAAVFPSQLHEFEATDALATRNSPISAIRKEKRHTQLLHVMVVKPSKSHGAVHDRLLQWTPLTKVIHPQPGDLGWYQIILGYGWYGFDWKSDPKKSGGLSVYHHPPHVIDLIDSPFQVSRSWWSNAPTVRPCHPHLAKHPASWLPDTHILDIYIYIII